MGWAVGLSLLSAASYAIAAVAQERLAERGHRGLSRWAVALLLTGAGVALHVVALNFGTVAVVQALGTLTLIFALPIQVIRYRTPVSRASWIDAGLTVFGLAVILLLSVEASGPALLGSGDVRVLGVITAGVVVVCALAARWVASRTDRWAGPRARAMLLAGAAGVAFGIASVLSKAVLASFTSGGFGAVSGLALAMVVAFSVCGYLLGQLSYKGAGLAAPLATVSVSNPLVAALAGVVLFDERVRFGVFGLVAVGVAALVMGWGVVGLARRTAAPGSRPGAPGEGRPGEGRPGEGRQGEGRPGVSDAGGQPVVPGPADGNEVDDRADRGVKAPEVTGP
ncbi:drug/metabolite transporter (DMT)-like permease [Actinoplanes lutulentus]|nr:DMT family transporter [Actinoplanes lutulentus]MBB2948068.1 drug/metabolite transporter (DMT)-like permease [Actinoplanes lutulentus]